MTVVIRIALVALIFAVLFWFVPVGALLAALQAADLLPVLAAIAVSLGQIVVGAARFKLLSDWHDIGIPLRRVLLVSFVTGFYTLVLPGELTGSLIRWQKLAAGRGKAAEVLAAIVFSRLVFTLTLIAFGALFMMLDAAPHGHVPAVAALTLALGFLLLCYGLAFHPASGRLWPRLAGLPAVPAGLLQRLARAHAAAHHYHRMPLARLSAVLACAVAENGLGVLGYLLLARAVDIDVGIAALGWIRTLVQIVALLPVSIAGLGVRDGSLVLLLGAYGVPAATAIALSLLIFTRIVLLAALGGVLEVLTVDRRGRRSFGASGGGPARFELRDGAILIHLLVAAPLAWLLPEPLLARLWAGAARFGAWLGGGADRVARSRIADIRNAVGGLPEVQAIAAALLEARLEQTALELREHRPGGWRPRLELIGRGDLEAALRGGRGAILWVAPFRGSSLVAKKALAQAGFGLVHLSAVHHGPADSAFGRRWLNRVRIGAENRHLVERVVFDAGAESAAVRTLMARLADNRVISITCTAGGRQNLTAPLLEASYAVASGAPALALGSGAALLPVVVRRRGAGEFVVEIEPPLSAAAAPRRRERAQELTRAYVARLEQWVRREPLLFTGWRDLKPSSPQGRAAAGETARPGAPGEPGR